MNTFKPNATVTIVPMCWSRSAQRYEEIPGRVRDVRARVTAKRIVVRDGATSAWERRFTRDGGTEISAYPSSLYRHRVENVRLDKEAAC